MVERSNNSKSNDEQHEVRITKRDIEQMLHTIGASADDLSAKLKDREKYGENTQKQMFELIQPLLHLRTGEEDEQPLRSLLHEQENGKEDRIEQLVDELLGYQPELSTTHDDKHEKQYEHVISAEDIFDDLLVADNDKYKQRKENSKKNQELRRKIVKILILIEQRKNGLLNHQAFIQQVNKIFPLAKNPPIIKFIERNGVNMQKTNVDRERAHVKELKENKKTKENTEQGIGISDLVTSMRSYSKPQSLQQDAQSERIINKARGSGLGMT